MPDFHTMTPWGNQYSDRSILIAFSWKVWGCHRFIGYPVVTCFSLDLPVKVLYIINLPFLNNTLIFLNSVTRFHSPEFS